MIWLQRAFISRGPVKLNSKYAEAVNNIGAVDYMQKNYGSAAKYFKKAVALEEARRHLPREPWRGMVQPEEDGARHRRIHARHGTRS